MTVSTLITQIITHDLQRNASDADNTDLRTHVLEWVVEVFAYVWTFREWSFRRTNTTLTVPAADNYASLPSDFSEIGHFGGVFDTNNSGHQLDYMDPQELLSRREMPGTVGQPEYYSIFGQSTDFSDRLQTERLGANASLSVWYLKAAPTLNEGGGDDNLKQVPEMWQQNTILPGVRAMARKSVGDARHTHFSLDSSFQAGLTEMVKRVRRGRETTQQMPTFSGGL